VAGRSVADRIITMTEEGKDRLVVETTTEKLAQHLGRAVYRAYKGEPGIPLVGNEQVRAGLLVAVVFIAKIHGERAPKGGIKAPHVSSLLTRLPENYLSFFSSQAMFSARATTVLMPSSSFITSPRSLP
jgi:hypothetical protein